MNNIMTPLREKVSIGSLKMFTAPYLPNNLIWTALLLAYTDCMIILLGQPAGYWIDRNRAASQFPFLKTILSSSILWYLLIALVYLVLLWIILTVLSRSWALVLWLTVSFLHLSYILAWFMSIRRILNVEAATAQTNVAIGTVSVLILGIIFVTMLLNGPLAGKTSSRLSGRFKMAVLGCWVVGLMAAITFSAIMPRGGWMEI